MRGVRARLGGLHENLQRPTTFGQVSCKFRELIFLQRLEVERGVGLTAKSRALRPTIMALRITHGWFY